MTKSEPKVLMDGEINIWDRFELKSGGYSETIDNQIYRVAKMIVEAREQDMTAFNATISEAVGITAEHTELIQYILAGVRYEDRPRPSCYPFEYGTSPRCLFVGDEECADLFIKEFEQHLRQNWGPND